MKEEELKQEINRELEKDLNTKSQSYYYKEFNEAKHEQKTFMEKFYEKLGFYNISLSEKERKELQKDINALEMKIKPSQVMAASMSTLVLGIAASAIVFLVTFSVYFFLGAVVGTFLAYKYVRGYPKSKVLDRRTQSSKELVMSVLYVVIYMRHTPNLEGAIEFASQNLEGPLSKDFRKMLWDVQSKKYPTVKEALDAYIIQWKQTNPEFVDSIFLVSSSIFQIDEQKRLALLDKALERILEGSYETMVSYSNKLKNPVEAVYMLGITLPIFGLITLPMIGAFLSDLISTQMILVLYDILLPTIVLVMIGKTLKTRPIAFSYPDISHHPLAPPDGTFWIRITKNKRIAVPALPISITLFVAGFLPFIAYSILRSPSAPPNEWDIYASIVPIITTSAAIYIYTYLTTFQRLKIREGIERLEQQFSDTTFQLANRISEGLPIEVAFFRVAEGMKGLESEKFFYRIVDNMEKLGMDAEQAIFDDKEGALTYYPSHIVSATMKIMLQGSKKSLEIASNSLTNVSRYLKNIHMINEKIKDVLSETLSSLNFQSAVVAPMISGIVVGLTAMIMIILSALNTKMSALQAQSQSGALSGLSSAWSIGFFSIKNAIPLTYFQLIVGGYFIEVVILMMYLGSRVESAGDPIKQNQAIGKTLLIATVIYSIVALGVTIFFVGIANIALLAGGSG